MLTKTLLEQLTAETRNTPVIFAPGLPPKTVNLMMGEIIATSSFFENLTNKAHQLDSTQIQIVIRQYLNLRGNLLKNTNIAYTRHPFFPTNQLCLKIAEAIAGDDEPVCKILMPYVVSLCRATYSLKSETEENGHFPLENYILNHQQNALIPVEEIFTTATVNTNLVFADFQNDSSSEVQYQLSEQDWLALKHITGESSSNYIAELKNHHAQRFDNGSIGFAIKTLAMELKKGSVVGVGTEQQVNIEIAAEAIKKFYILWKALPAETKSSVNSFKIQNYGYADLSLENYFLALFGGILGCELTPEELEQQKKDKIFLCAHQISLILEEFLTQNPGLYTITLNAQAMPVKLTDLNPLQKQALEALKTRSQVALVSNKNLFTNLVNLLVKSPLPDSVQNVAAQIEPHIQDFFQLSVLTESPEILNELLKLIRPRLGDLQRVETLPNILRFLSLEDQKIIIDIHAKTLFSLIKTPNDYQRLVKSSGLKQELVYYFHNLYSDFLLSNINTLDDCFFILQHIPDKDLLLHFLLSRRIQKLFNNNFEALTTLLELFKHEQSTVIVAFFEQLIQWEPQRIYMRVAENAKRCFATQYVFHMKPKIHNFNDFLDVLSDWQYENEYHQSYSDGIIQNTLLIQFEEQLKRWVNNEQNLSSLLKHLVRIHSGTVLKKFAYLISSKESCEHFFALVPGKNRTASLTINFKTFLTSLEDFFTFSAPLSANERLSILEQLTYKDLNCTQEKFESLVLVNTVATKLENYPVSDSRSLTRDQLVNALNENPNISIEQIIDLLRKCLVTIDSSYTKHHSLFPHSTNQNAFLKFIEQLIDEISSFKERSSSYDYMVI